METLVETDGRKRVAYNIMYKTLGFRCLFEPSRPASAFVSADRDVARNPQRFIHVTVVCNNKTKNELNN